MMGTLYVPGLTLNVFTVFLKNKENDATTTTCLYLLATRQQQQQNIDFLSFVESVERALIKEAFQRCKMAVTMGLE